MRTLFASLPLGAALLGDASLSTRYDPGRVFRVDVETTVKTETTRLEFGGGGGGPWGGDVSSKLSRKEMHVDRIVEAEHSRVKRTHRSFESVYGRASFTSGPSTREVDIESPLQSVTIDIERSDEGMIDVSVAQGKRPSDDAALKHHAPELFLDGLLPDREVEADATWNLDNDTIRRALRLDLDSALYSWAGRDERADLDSVLLERAEWTGKARLVSIDEEIGGMTCAVIAVEIRATGDLPERATAFNDRRSPDPEVEARSGATSSTYQIKLEGRFLFATKQKRPVSLDLQGTMRTEERTEPTRKKQTIKVLHLVREGPVNYRVAVFEERETDGR
jgi:hypothetical protein